MIPLSEIESSEHSQNGEDGIIRYLLARVLEPDQTFLEIGSGRGTENNTTALLRRGYRGVAVERKHARVKGHREYLRGLGLERSSTLVQLHVTATNAPELLAKLATLTPDFFSLDIDGIDWHVWRALSRAGFRPKVACLEYNPSFGREPVSVPARHKRPDALRNIYFGCGLEMWRRTLEPAYRFVTVCSAGINAFFVDPAAVASDGLDDVAWLAWSDCAEIERLEGPIEARWERARERELVRLEDAA